MRCLLLDEGLSKKQHFCAHNTTIVFSEVFSEKEDFLLLDIFKYTAIIVNNSFHVAPLPQHP